MINPMQNKTVDERRAIAAKGVATRRARSDERKSAEQEAIKRSNELRQQICDLEKRLSALQRMETMSLVSAAVTNKVLLREDDIAKSAIPWNKASGVYFLLDGDDVVYVGQAVNVYSRIGQHTDKIFDRYAFVPCAVDALNIIESLYIHCLRPRLNGNQINNAKCAPIPLDILLGMARNQ